MTLCSQARKLFGAYWDDETTQAEREWLETHFTACGGCRREYDELARSLELAASLPRIEPAPDFAERALARARRAVPVGDRVHAPGVQWVPVTAAAALLLVAAMMVSPWIGLFPRERSAPVASLSVPNDPQLVGPAAPQSRQAPTVALFAEQPVASAVSDSLFNHSEDIEFILDPVTVNRGRATLRREPGGTKAEQAVITF